MARQSEGGAVKGACQWSTGCSEVQGRHFCESQVREHKMQHIFYTLLSFMCILLLEIYLELLFKFVSVLEHVVMFIHQTLLRHFSNFHVKCKN